MDASTGAVLSVLLDFESVAALIGRKPDKATRLWCWRAAKTGAFVSPVQAGGRIFWRRSEVEGWLANLPRAKYGRQEARDAA